MTLPTFTVGQKLLAADLQTLANYLAQVEDTTPGTAAVNFSDSGSVARVTGNGSNVTVELNLLSANAITATTGNFADVTCYTLDTPYCPSETVGGICFGNGSTTGECDINSAGVVSLRSASDTVAAASTIRITATFKRSA